MVLFKFKWKNRPQGSTEKKEIHREKGGLQRIKRSAENKEGCKVYHKDLYGLRKDKYHWLLKNDFQRKNYDKLEPQTPYYFFIKRTTQNILHYLEWKKISEILPVNSVGIVTSRDDFVIDFDRKSLANKVLQFKNLSLPDNIIAHTFNLKDNKNWSLSEVRNRFAKQSDWQDYFQDVLYRPFDVRNIFYYEEMIERPRSNIMRHMIKGTNLGITIGRQGHVVGASNVWNLAFISDKIIDLNLYYRGGAVLFPLYLYTAKEENNPRRGGNLMMVFDDQAPYLIRKPNIDPKIYGELERIFKEKPTPEQILYYIYGIFYSNTYRTRYAEFLKIDFPRVPFTANYEMFKKVTALGKQLTDLHLLKSEMLNEPISKYRGSGDNDRIENIIYDSKKNCVYINKDKHFDGIMPELWNYHIGGYQVLHKFLKDRKGRIMDNSRHYSRIVTAISKTISLQKQIDDIYSQIEKTIIEL